MEPALEVCLIDDVVHCGGRTQPRWAAFIDFPNLCFLSPLFHDCRPCQEITKQNKWPMMSPCLKPLIHTHTHTLSLSFFLSLSLSHSLSLTHTHTHTHIFSLFLSLSFSLSLSLSHTL